MKKMISVLLAAAALVSVGVARADAECNASGRCGTLAPYQGGDANGNYDPRVAEAYGLVPPGTAQAYYNQAYAGMYGVPPALADGGWAQTADGRWIRRQDYGNGYAAPYPRTRNDRDGDGVRNNRDRYPDDPRYH